MLGYIIITAAVTLLITFAVICALTDHEREPDEKIYQQELNKKESE